jgi:peptidoglycan hydrolase-like protein with peptidoglycan-binding domain
VPTITPRSPVSSITTPGPTNTGPCTCGAFKKDPTLSKLALGTTPPLAKGAKSDSVKVVQAALFSLGFLKPRAGLDGSFGPGTENSVKAFQATAGLPQTGSVDGATLRALDQKASMQMATLRTQTKSDDAKRTAYHVVADISDPNKTRLYVLDAQDRVTARYLTSPGRAAFPTKGDHFHVTDVLTRATWNPPNSGWAKNAKPIGPGLDNPMGLTKLSLGAYSQYIHGIPASEEPELGHAASHGCLRVSGSNVLELGEKYAGTGTDVSINRDRARSAKLEAAFQQSGVTERPTDAGREYLFGYLGGDLGSTRHA